MSFSATTTQQLEFLGTWRARSRLELLLRKGRDPATGEVQPGFESTDACCTEDHNRARAIRGVPHKLWAKVPGCDPDRLAALLETISDPGRSKPAPSCLASAMYVRSRRIGVLGSILDLVRDHPGLDFAWISASHPTLCFDQKERWSDVCRLAHDRLQQDLERSRALGVPGLVIACLNGYFDPGTKKFRVQYRGIVAGEKLKRIRAVANLDENGERLRSRINIVVHQIKDLQQQIAGVMPNFLPELVPLRTNSLSNIKRMRQPYHSIYLMWLDQQSLADMWVINGAFYSDGHLVMAECYQATAGQAMRSRRSLRVMRP